VSHLRLSPAFNPLSSQAMHRDHQCWYSHLLSRHMGVAIYGNYGAPILAFPTSMGDEWEQEGQSMIRTLSPYIEQGRIRIYCINGVQSDSFANKGAHPSTGAGCRRSTTTMWRTKFSRSSIPSARHRASGLPRWAHRSVPTTRPTRSSLI